MAGRRKGQKFRILLHSNWKRRDWKAGARTRSQLSLLHSQRICLGDLRDVFDKRPSMSAEKLPPVAVIGV